MKPHVKEVLDILKDEEEGYKPTIPVIDRGREHVLYDRLAFGERPKTSFVLKHLL